MANDINGGLRNVLPGPLDFLRGPYDSLATANGAIPSVVVGGKNFRQGKFVEIGSNGVYKTYWWRGTGQYLNSDLEEYVIDPDLSDYPTLDEVYTKSEVYRKNETLPATDLYSKTQTYNKTQVDQMLINGSADPAYWNQIFDSKLPRIGKTTDTIQSLADVYISTSGNIIWGFNDPDTGEVASGSRVTQLPGGVEPTPEMVDGKTLVLLDGQYFKIQVDGQGWVNAKRFGLKGDAYVDSAPGSVPIGTDNTDTWEEMMNYCTKNRVGIYLPWEGGYYAARYMRLKADVSIRGAAERVRLVPLPSSEPRFIYMDAAPLQRVTYSNLTIDGFSVNSGQHGMDFTATYTPSSGVTASTGGFWYSQLKDIEIKGFLGTALKFSCTDVSGAGDMANQFITMTNVRCFAGALTTSRSMTITGQMGQFTAIECLFDGINKDIGGRNVDLFSLTTGNDQIFGAINFLGCTFQNRDIGVRLLYAQGVNFIGCWFEDLRRSILATDTSRFNVHGNHFANAGEGDGDGVSGYLVDVRSSQVSWDNNHVLGTADFHVISSNGNADGVKIGKTFFNGRSVSLKTKGIVPLIEELSTAQTPQPNTIDLINLDQARVVNRMTSTSSTRFINTIKCQHGPNEIFTIGFHDGSNENSFTEFRTGGNIVLPKNANGSVVCRFGDMVLCSKDDIDGNIRFLSIQNNQRRGTNAPANGFWKAGEIIYNDTPISSTNTYQAFFQCIESGNPGKWVACIPSPKLTKVSTPTTVTPGNSIENVVITAATSVTLAPSATSLQNITRLNIEKRFYNKSGSVITIVLGSGVTVDGSSSNISLAVGEILELVFDHTITGGNGWIMLRKGL